LSTRTNNPWIVRSSTGDPKIQLFCFPCAGAGATAFREWPSLLPSYVEHCAVQLPGRESRIRERPFTRMPALADAVADALMPECAMPFVLFGHSLGALLSFEVARRLRDWKGLTPKLLVCSSSPAPHLVQKKRDDDLSDAELVSTLKTMRGVPPAVFDHPELLRILLPIIRADFEVVNNYRYEAGDPVECPILSVCGSEDEEVQVAEQHAWRAHTTKRLSSFVFPGGHFYLYDKRQALIDLLRAEIQNLSMA
jgi:medium-chain acyl-[acyl-carrier-protein] hydrolase